MPGKAVRVMSFSDVVADAQKRQAEAEEFVKATGKCFACKTNPVVPGTLQCAECVKKTEDILKKLRGPGFMSVMVERR